MAKSVHDLVADRFGVRTRVNEVVGAQAPTASAVLLRDNPMRYAFVVQNLGADPVFMRPRRAASATAGIRLGANGGSISFSVDEDFSLPGLEWWSFTSGAAAVDIIVLEVLGEPDARAAGGVS